MHRIKLLVVVVIGIATACGAGCKSRHESQQPPPTSATGDTDFAKTRDRVVQQMQDRLAALDVKLANLKRDTQARSAQLTGEARTALADAIAKLDGERAAAQQTFERARSSTDEGWDQIKTRAEEALTKIDDAYDAAAKKLRE